MTALNLHVFPPVYTLIHVHPALRTVERRASCTCIRIQDKDCTWLSFRLDFWFRVLHIKISPLHFTLGRSYKMESSGYFLSKPHISLNEILIIVQIATFRKPGHNILQPGLWPMCSNRQVSAFIVWSCYTLINFVSLYAYRHQTMSFWDSLSQDEFQADLVVPKAFIILGIWIFSIRECYRIMLHCWVQLVRQIPTWDLDKCKCHIVLWKSAVAIPIKLFKILLTRS